MIANNLQSGIYASLSSVAIFFVDKMKQKIRDVKAPSKIANHISINSPVVEERSAYIDIVIDTSKDGAPMAGAYEWGKEPYRIPPEGETHMAFPISKWPKYQPPPNVEFASFPGPISRKGHVIHPYIVPRPYIEPTIKDNLPEIKRMLAYSFKQAIISGIEKVVVIE